MKQPNQRKPQHAVKKASEAVESLRKRVEMLQAVIDNFPGGIVLTDQDLQVVLCNHQQKQLLQYPASLFKHGNPSLRELFHFNAARGEYGPGDVDKIVDHKMELVRRREPHVFERTRPNGQIIEIRGVPLESGGFVTSYTDVTENRRNQLALSELAFTDALTGLSNRVHFNDRLAHAAAFARRGEQFALHFIDLDDFKPINDRFGHAAGDLVLQETAKRLRSILRDTDTIARLGGDEFVIIQANMKSATDVLKLAQRVIAVITAPIEYASQTIAVGASVGIALSTEKQNDPHLLLKQADFAMLKSKNEGKSKASLFGPNDSSALQMQLNG